MGVAVLIVVAVAVGVKVFSGVDVMVGVRDISGVIVAVAVAVNCRVDDEKGTISTLFVALPAPL